ncbi:MAG: CapA family protein [Clostridiales bacterium]|nr:CapA family protein [Clostridiales bacterium]
MRRLLMLLLALTLAFGCALAEEDEELSILDVLNEVHPDVVEDTIVQPPTEEEIAEQEAASIYEPDGSVLITLSAAGDLRLGGELYEAELAKYAGDAAFVMRNIRETMMEDDLTIVNVDGATAESAAMLPLNGVEAVTLANDGTQAMDEAARQELRQALEDGGATCADAGEIAVREVKGLKIALLSYDCSTGYEKLWNRIPQDVAAAKTQYPVVIASFHWGSENSYMTDGDQVQMGRLAVDSGADLVLGHRSRRIQPIEFYNGAYICYSLGSFCYTAEEKPSDMSSFIFQLRLRLRDGVLTQEGFRILPIRISSRTDRNDFAPSLMDKVTAVDSILGILKENGRTLQYAVEQYPVAW